MKVKLRVIRVNERETEYWIDFHKDISKLIVIAQTFY